MALIKRSDMSRYGPLMTDIRDQYGYVVDVYPKTLVSDHNMLEDYARSRKIYPKKKKTTTNEGIFRDKYPGDNRKGSVPGIIHAHEEIVPGTNVRTCNTVKCHDCSKYGHYSSHYTEEK